MSEGEWKGEEGGMSEEEEYEIHKYVPENIDIVNSGRNCANCLDKKRWDRQ